jgi:hypothetical protein
MSSLATAVITLACVFGAALLGMLVRPMLPESHLSEASRDTVKLMTGLMATLSALVLGLLIASAKNSYDHINEVFLQTAAKVILLDRALAEYGPDTTEVRKQLLDDYTTRINQLFPGKETGTSDKPLARRPLAIQAVEVRLRALLPPTDAQRAHLTRALQLVDDMTRVGWLFTIEQTDSSLPAPMLVVLIAWLAAMFAGFGLLAPRNATTVVSLLIGALGVSTSIFLIEEMSHPLEGVISIPAAPMRDVINYLGR